MEAGVALLADGELVEAVSEERFTRVKGQAGFPRQSIDYVFAKHGVSWADLDSVATHGVTWPPGDVLADFTAKEQDILAGDLDLGRKQEQVTHLWRRYGKERAVRAVRIPGQLAQLTSRHTDVRVYPHHLAHAASGYFYSAREDAHLLTADGWGEDGSGLVGSATGTRLNVACRSPTISSLGYFYGAITWFLGFTPHRHEGKVLGMAAHGDPRTTYPLLSKLIRYDPQRRSLDGRYELGYYITHYRNPWLAELLEGYSAEDVAAGAQQVLETCVLALLDDQLHTRRPLCAAGGVFANVRLNQKVAGHPKVAGLHIPPHMGDGGLAFGAAALCHRDLTGKRVTPPDHVFLGSQYSDAQVERALAKSALHYARIPAIEETVARLLAEGQVVARFAGRMEYGARALGNRSVLAPATDPLIAVWLNDRLRRTDVMPFAPVTLAQFAAERYHGLDALWPNTRIMTITADCTPVMRAESPACVHVDGTARPQLLAKDDNVSFHRILADYYHRTGIPTLINTSFNVHDEPIVESPDDAIRAVGESGLRYLAIGSYLAENRHPAAGRGPSPAGSADAAAK